MFSRALPFLIAFSLVPCLASAQEIQSTEGSGATTAKAAQSVPTAASADGPTWKDAKSELVWQRTAADRDMMWKDGLAYCESNIVGLPGSGWRLPTVDELKGILLKEKSGKCSWPPDLKGDCGIYWSATEAGSKSEAYYVDFAGRLADFDDKGFAYRVRCVRKGL